MYAHSVRGTQTHLRMERLVLESHLHDSGDLARKRHLARVDIAVEVHHTLANSRLELQDARQ